MYGPKNSLPDAHISGPKQKVLALFLMQDNFLLVFLPIMGKKGSDNQAKDFSEKATAFQEVMMAY